MEYRLKKKFCEFSPGSKVIAEDSYLFTGELITWYGIVDKDGSHIRLGNSVTMNVDEWIEKVPEEKKQREFKLQLINGRAVNIATYPPGRCDKVEYIDVVEKREYRYKDFEDYNNYSLPPICWISGIREELKDAFNAARELK